MKKTLGFLAALLLCAAAASAGQRVTFVPPLVANPYWDVVERGARLAAKEYNVELDYVGPTQLDINEMMKYLEAAIAQRVDGIATMALNEAALAPIINQAVGAGIPVILVDTDAPKSRRTAYAGTDNVTAGKVLGENLARIKNGKAKIGMMTGALDQPSLNQRMEGFRQAIASYPDMVEVALEGDNSDLQICIQKGEAMLRAYPEIDALAGFEGFGVPGLSRVVKEAGKVGQITVVGFDDLADTFAFIRDGTAIGTTVQRQFMMGYLGVELAVKAANGEKLNSIYDTGVLFIDKSNIDTFDPEAK
ncbi:MAG: sugar-binding protein [Planctomycetota bacterium]|jgi:ribose transport system substrate-binding protein|nr:sugar-binding protein [Planctomycetota bacterium]